MYPGDEMELGSRNRLEPLASCNGHLGSLGEEREMNVRRHKCFVCRVFTAEKNRRGLSVALYIFTYSRYLGS